MFRATLLSFIVLAISTCSFALDRVVYMQKAKEALGDEYRWKEDFANGTGLRPDVDGGSGLYVNELWFLDKLFEKIHTLTFFEIYELVLEKNIDLRHEYGGVVFSYLEEIEKESRIFDTKGKLISLIQRYLGTINRNSEYEVLKANKLQGLMNELRNVEKDDGNFSRFLKESGYFLSTSEELYKVLENLVSLRKVELETLIEVVRYERGLIKGRYISYRDIQDMNGDKYQRLYGKGDYTREGRDKVNRILDSLEKKNKALTLDLSRTKTLFQQMVDGRIYLEQRRGHCNAIIARNFRFSE